MTNRIEITVSDEVLARLNAARGHEPRASFVKRALDAALAPREPYPFEAERQAVREAVAQGAEGVRVEAGSIRPAAVTDGANLELGPYAGVLKDEWAEPEPSSGCPGCGGEMTHVVSPEGGYPMCRDCGFRS